MNTTKKTRKKWPWIVLAIVIVIVAAIAILMNSMASRQNTIRYSTYTVAPGNVATTITGSGQLEAADSVEIELPEGVTVRDIYVEPGDVVAEGDVIAKLDRDSLENSAAALSSELESLDRQISSRSTKSSISSPVKGRIKYLPVSEGDDVLKAQNEYGVLAIISTDGLMKIEIETEADLELYSTVTVKWADDSEDGEVSQKTSKGYVITLDDNGVPYHETAKVYDGETLLGEGTLEVNAPIDVYGTGGTIDDIRYDENDKISANSKLFTLTNEPDSDSYRQSLTERNEKAEELKLVTAYLNDPQVLAPAGGTVSQVNVSENKKAGASSSSSASVDTTGSSSAAAADTASASSTNTSDGTVVGFVVNTGGAVKMTIQVDELDINSVALEQQADITLDAYASETFSATVSHISKMGTASGSITTYAVELTLEQDERLLEGMNGSAVITAERAENVLIIPVAAIREDATGAYVYVQTADGSQNRTDIITGLSDGTNAEVKSGLSEGDTVIYVDNTDAASNSSSPMMGGMGGMGGQGMGGSGMGGGFGAPAGGE